MGRRNKEEFAWVRWEQLRIKDVLEEFRSLTDYRCVRVCVCVVCV